MILNVFVPANNDGQFLEGCALVAKPSSGLIKVYLEANLYNADTIKTYEHRLLHAAGRCAQNYPTTAFRMVPVGMLELVGEYDTEGWAFNAYPEKLSVLNGWIGEKRFVHVLQNASGDSHKALTSKFSFGERQLLIQRMNDWIGKISLPEPMLRKTLKSMGVREPEPGFGFFDFIDDEALERLVPNI